MPENSNSQKKSTTPIIIGAMGAIIVLLVVLIVMIMSRGANTEPTQQEEPRNVVVTQDNVEEVVEDILENDATVEAGYYTVTMPTTWHFPTGDAASSDAIVINKEENTNDVYFDLFLADNEEDAILKSPVIPRGGEMQNISLDTPLEAGTYDCVMVYHLIDEQQTTISTLRVGVTIIVEE